jgi:hypothetical protein
MPTILTCGKGRKATFFTYEGDIHNGLILIFPSGQVQIRATFIRAIIDNFQGQTIKLGASMTGETQVGFGAWIANNSLELNQKRLTRRHASFIAAVLRESNALHVTYIKRSVLLKFLVSIP